MKTLAIVAMMLGLGAGGVGCKGGDPGAAEPAPGNTAAADQLQLIWKPAAIGDVITSVDKTQATMELAIAPGQVTTMVMSTQKQGRFEVLEVTADGAIARIRVHYAHSERQVIAGQLNERPIPIDGKTYLVWAEAGAIQATHDDGSQVSAEEHAAIAEQEDELGTIPGTARLLLGRVWRTGEQVTLSVDGVAQVLGPDKVKKPVSGHMTLTRVAAGIASFGLEIAAYSQDPHGRLDASVQMTFELDVAQLRPIVMTMSGSFAGQLDGLPATGSVIGTKTFSYE